MNTRHAALAALLTVACASSPRRVRRPRPAAPAPTLEGRAVYPGPLPAERLVAYWDHARAQLADAPPDAAQGPDAARDWARRRVDALRSLGFGAQDIHARGDVVDELFAAVVYGAVTDDLRARLDALGAARTPPDVTARSEQFVATSLAAWRRCAELAPAAAPEQRAWGPVCDERAQALAPVAARVAAAAAAAARRAAAPPPPPPVTIPDGCEDGASRERLVDPEAPAPVSARPREVLVRYVDDGARDGFDDAARERLVAATRAWIARSLHLPLVPVADVRAAEALARARRWRPAGPACGQAPPLPALLAAAHPNLVVASLSTWCGDVVEEGGAPGAPLVSRARCSMSLTFHRAGTDDRAGLPAERGVSLEAPRGDVARWVEAVPRMTPEGGLSLLGGLMAGEGPTPYYRAAGFGDDDPWLRVGTTLLGYGGREAVRDAMQSCAPRRPHIGRYALSFTISPAGETASPAVTASSPDDADVARCLADRLREVAWPCPRAGRPVPVEAALCVGWR